MTTLLHLFGLFEVTLDLDGNIDRLNIESVDYYWKLSRSLEEAKECKVLNII